MEKGEATFDLERLSTIEILRSRAEVEAIQTDDSNRLTHYVAKIHRIYDVTPVDAMVCNFPDRRPHAFGYVIDSQCSKRMRIGNVCAGTWLAGDGAALMKRVRAKYAQGQGQRGALAKDPAGMIATLTEIEPLAKSAENFRRALALARPALMSEIERRLRLTGGKRTEVMVTTKEIRGGHLVDVQQSSQLVGLDSVTRV